MNDFNQIHALYHSDMAKMELERRKRNYQIINCDFLQDLPEPIRSVMDRLRWDYGNRSWFPEAWEKYRKIVLEAGLGGKIKMPGSVFNEYFDKYELKELEKIYANSKSDCEVAYHSDMYMDDYLEHHGVKGQKWGIRRYQNEDGTLTEEGMVRYGVDKHGNMSEEGAKIYKKDNTKNSNEQKVKNGKRIGALIGAGIIAGTYATGKLLRKFGKGKASDFGSKMSGFAGKTKTIAGPNGSPMSKTRISLGKLIVAGILGGMVGKKIAKTVNERKAEKQDEKEEHTKQYLDSIEYQRKLAKKGATNS